jgi:hypothetical protein
MAFDVIAAARRGGSETVTAKPVISQVPRNITHTSNGATMHQ